MTKQMNKARENLVKEILNCLENDDLVWRKGWITADQDRFHNPVSKTFYKGTNILSLLISSMVNGYKDTRWCTYKQANDKGWQVKQGSKGVHIEYYSMYDKAKKEYVSLSEYQKLIKNERSPEDFSLISRTYVVFNAECIDGIPPREHKDRPLSNIDMNDFCQNLITNMKVGYEEWGGKAFYSPLGDTVTMPPKEYFKSQHEFDSTLLHELSHATGHVSRLNRDLSGGFGSESYAIEELRAEFSSIFTSQYLNINFSQVHLDNHKAYVKSWAKKIKDKPNILFQAIKEAEKMSDYLMEKGEIEKYIDLNQELNEHDLDDKGPKYKNDLSL